MSTATVRRRRANVDHHRQADADEMVQRHQYGRDAEGQLDQSHLDHAARCVTHEDDLDVTVRSDRSAETKHLMMDSVRLR